MRQFVPYSYVHFQNHVTREIILTRQMKITSDNRERVVLCELSYVCGEYCSQTEHSAFDEVIPLFKVRVITEQYIPKKTQAARYENLLVI
jgi:hypothetical protein